MRYFYLLIVFVCTPVYYHAEAQNNPDVNVRLTSYFAGATDSQLPFWLHSNQNGRFGQSQSGFGWMGLNGGVSHNIGSGIQATTAFEGFLRQGNRTHPVLNQWWVEFRKHKARLYAGARPDTRGNTFDRLTSGSMGRSRNAAPVPKIGLDVSYVSLPFTAEFVEVKGHLAHGWFEKDRYTSSPFLHEKSLYFQLGGNLPVHLQAGLVHFSQYGGYTPGYGGHPAGFSDYLKIIFARSGDDVSDVPGEWYALGNHIGVWDLSFDIDLKHVKVLMYRQWIIETGKELLFNTPQDGLLGMGIQRSERGAFVEAILWEFLYTKYQNGPHPASKIPGKSGRKNYYNNVLYRSGWTYHGRTIGNPLLFPSRDKNLVHDGRRIANTRVVAHHIGFEGTLMNRLSYRTLFTYSRNYGTYQNQSITEKQGLDYLFKGGARQYSFLFHLETVLPVLHNPALSVSVAIDRGEVHPNNNGLMLGLSWDIMR